MTDDPGWDAIAARVKDCTLESVWTADEEDDPVLPSLPAAESQYTATTAVMSEFRAVNGAVVASAYWAPRFCPLNTAEDGGEPTAVLLLLEEEDDEEG